MEGFLDFLFVVGFIAFVVRMVRKANTKPAAKPVDPTVQPLPGYSQADIERMRNAAGQPQGEDRTSRNYQGISRPQPVQSAAKASATVPMSHGAGAPSKGSTRPNPAVRRAMERSVQQPETPPVQPEADPVQAAAADEFCAVPETHSHAAPKLDDMQSRMKNAVTPSREELRKAVIWAEILGSRGGRAKTCRP